MTTHRDSLEFGGSVWLKSGEEMLGGASRIALLAAIRDTGSITAATKAVGMSYKGRGDAVDTMNNLAGEPLVRTASGGRGGAENHRDLSRRGARASQFSSTCGRGHRRLCLRLATHRETGHEN